jgi:class 3 adenylate cyclase
MKRISYMSIARHPLSDEELKWLGTNAARQNAKKHITGILLTIGDTFFQTIEGPDEAIEALFKSIRKDERHKNIVCIGNESNVTSRLFPKWSMKTVNLDKEQDQTVSALRELIRSLSSSHFIIGRYTQPIVSEFLRNGQNPLEIPVKTCNRVVMFVDIVGFSLMMTLRPINEMSDLVNTVLDLCAGAIYAKQGEVTKFMGDGLLAYWDGHNVDLALESAIECYRAVRELRRGSETDSIHSLVHVGFGLALGEVIEGNFGSHQKTDYTILGDSVNMAARLEKLTRTLEQPICVTEQLREAASDYWNFLELGLQQVPGMPEPARLFTIDHPDTKDYMEKEKLVRLILDLQERTGR